jgi:predicted nucleotidyltransferase
VIENPNLPWLQDRTLLYVLTGSRAYGTHREDSDYDYRGVCVPPVYYRTGFLHRFEQTETGKNTEQDAVIYGIQRFFKLAADCNPNILELLWVANDCVVKVDDPYGLALLDLRDKFLSQKVRHTFRGYAISQLRRIKTHRRWLLNPPQAKPVRADYNLPERTVIPADQLQAAQSLIQKKMDSWEIDFGELPPSSVIYIQEQMINVLQDWHIGNQEKLFAAGRLLGYEDNFLQYLDQEKRYKAALTEWHQYHEWKEKRNQKRAAMEASFGYDGKHAMHLVRLMRMCREILTEGVVHVRRPDAEELKSIMQGAWSYDKLLGWATDQDQELLELATDLPKKPPLPYLDGVCSLIVGSVKDGWDK